MAILGMILIAALVACGLFAAFVVVVSYWIVMAVFWISALGILFFVHDPYLSFFLAFPVTALILWGITKASNKTSASKRT